MTIPNDIKAKIEAEFKEWEAQQYAGKSKEERQKMAQFFTPPVLSIKMVEKFDSLTKKDILDPAAGAGGLLVAMIFAGADPTRVYGIELDPAIANICRARLAKLGVPRHHIHVGDALDSQSYEFEANPKSYSLALSKSGKVLSACLTVGEKDSNIQLSDANGSINEKNAKSLHKILSTLVSKELAADAKTNKNVTILSKLFKKFNLQEV